MRLPDHPSANFEDRTGWSEKQQKINTIATLLSPAIAAGNVYDWMQAHGLAPIHGVKLGITDILKGQ